jgi:hypothetical protein
MPTLRSLTQSRKTFTYGLPDGDLPPKNIGCALVAVFYYLLFFFSFGFLKERTELCQLACPSELLNEPIYGCLFHFSIEYMSVIASLNLYSTLPFSLQQCST